MNDKNVTNNDKPEIKQEVAPVNNKVEESKKEVSTDNNSKKSSSKNAPDNSTGIAKEFLPENFNPFARPVNPRFTPRPTEFEERVLQVKRVIKVTKGGRRFKFSALVVIGDRNGRVGYGIGKHIEVPEAIKKGTKQAKKNLYRVKIVGDQNTIPHPAIGHHGAARVMLKPAQEGKGIISSDVIRAVVELAGYRNIYSKNLGTNNPHNVVIATIAALDKMQTKEEIMALRKGGK